MTLDTVCYPLQIVPGGPCDKGKYSLVQPGDRLVFVDGVPVLYVASYIHAIFPLQKMLKICYRWL
jgi:hypothetical protein